ncbi:MAG: HEAT repeat domain-containing protein, partial [Desulfobacula sp.]|uniref:HEAT repeat domain-containing protein n=1 Tax=Desulfobacula sp. TaxID=2593537 RepID=UPI0025C50A97
SGNKNDRLYAVRQLREIKDAQIIPVLIEMLDNEDSQFREAAAYSLGGKSNDYLSIDPLIEALEDEDAKVRKTALSSLSEVLRSVGMKKARRAPVPIMAALHDEDYLVRMAAAQSLGWFGDTAAVEPLINVLGDNDFLVNMWAHKSLVRITGQEHLGDDPARWREWLKRQDF